MKISCYCNHIIVGLLIIVTFAVPIFFDIRLYSVFDLSKVIAMIFPGLFIMAVWLIKIIFKEKFEFPHTQLNLPILAYISITIIALIFSVNPYMSLTGGYKRFEGLIETCTYIFLFFAIVRFINTESKLNLLIHTIVIAAVVTSIYGFMQYFEKDPYKWSSNNIERIFSTFGNPVFYSAYLITSLPLSLALYLGYKAPDGKTSGFPFYHRRIWKDIAYGICTLLIYTIFWHTKTRACYVGLMFSLPLFFIFLGKERIYAYKWKLSIMIVLFIIIGIFYSLRPESSVFSYFAREITLKKEQNTSIENKAANKPKPDDRFFLADKLSGSSFNRYYQFKTGLRIFNEYPFLGIGPDTLGIIYQKHLAEVFTRRKEDENWPRHDRIHNDVLDTVVAKGAIGLTAYIWLICAYFWLAWKFLKVESSKLKAKSSNLAIQSSIINRQSSIDKGLLVVSLGSGILGYIVQNEFSFGNTPIVALFWTLLALTVVVINGLHVRSSQLTTRNSQPATRKVLLSLLVMSLIAFLAIHFFNWYKADIYMEKGRRYTDAGQVEAGLNYYSKSTSYNPFETNYRDMMNTALFSLVFKTKDKVWLEQIADSASRNLELIPQHYLGFFALGNVYYLLAQDHGENTLDPAIEYYKKAIASDPFQPDIYHHLAMAYGRKGMMKEGTEALENAFINRPGDILTIDKLAKIYLQQNQMDKLHELFEYTESITIPPSASFSNSKGVYLGKSGKNEEAFAEFTKAVEIDNTDPPTLENIISLGIFLNKIDETIKHLNLALKLNPNNTEYRKKLGELYAQKGLFDESVVEFNQISQIDPNKQIECWDAIGRVYMAKNDMDNAILYFKKAIESGSPNAELLNNLGTMYAQKGLYNEAISEINNALALKPAEIIFQENLAKIYFIQGNLSGAESIFNNILKLNANHEEAKKLLAQIKQKRETDDAEKLEPSSVNDQ